MCGILKTIYVWFLRALSDFNVLASGLVAKNSTLGLRPHALFLATRPEACTLNPIIHSEPYINYYLICMVRSIYEYNSLTILKKSMGENLHNMGFKKYFVHLCIAIYNIQHV